MNRKEISARNRLGGEGRTAKKTANKTAKPSPRSGVSLPVGAHPGNTGGKKGRSGRLPSMIRDLAREGFADNLDTLIQMADGHVVRRVRVGDAETESVVNVEVSDRLRAIDLLGKYGLGTVREVSIEDVRERVHRTLDVVQERTSPDQCAAIIEAIRPIWR